MIGLLKYKTKTFKAIPCFRSNYPFDTGALNLVLAFIQPAFALNICVIVVRGTWCICVLVCRVCYTSCRCALHKVDTGPYALDFIFINLIIIAE